MRSINQFGMDDPTEKNNLKYYQSVDITMHENGDTDVKIGDIAHKCANREEFMRYMQSIYDSTMQLMHDQRNRDINDRLHEGIEYIASCNDWEIEHSESIMTRSIDVFIDYVKIYMPKYVNKYCREVGIRLEIGEGKYDWQKGIVLDLTVSSSENAFIFIREKFDEQFAEAEHLIRAHLAEKMKNYKDPMIIQESNYIKIVEADHREESHSIITDSLSVMKGIIENATKDYNDIYINAIFDTMFNAEYHGYKWVTISKHGDKNQKSKSRLHGIFTAIKSIYTSPMKDFVSYMQKEKRFYWDSEGSCGIEYKAVIQKDIITIFKALAYYGK